jgi:hypothetical protein
MKKIILTVIAAAISYCIAYTQPCLPEGISFYTQEEIDNFQTNYPGCTEIEGNVLIGTYNFLDSTNIANLNSLNVLTVIEGSLIIAGNNLLTSLSGLNNLTSIGGNLEIGYGFYGGNPALISVTGLESLNTIEGSLFITYNDALTSLTGLENLTSIGGSMTIGDDVALISLAGLESLTSIGSGLYIGNTSLTSLTGLENLISLGGYITLSGNNNMTSLSSLENLNSTSNLLNIEIYVNNNLTNLFGLDNLNIESIESLTIFGNPSLSICNVQSVCEILEIPNIDININNNASGCYDYWEVLDSCLIINVAEIKTQQGLNIIPNPSKDIISITVPSLKTNAILSIFNVRGNKVIERQLKDNETQLNISDLPLGVYFVRLQNEKMVEVGKMVKE